jgi:hypothetical protein
MRTLATAICLALAAPARSRASSTRYGAGDASAQSGQTDARSSVIDVSRGDPVMQYAKRLRRETLPEFLAQR